MRYRWFAASILGGGALVMLAACGSSNSSTSNSAGNTGNAQAANGSGATSAPSATGLKETSTSLGEVLTTSSGQVLYWFASDTSTTSNCSGSCAQYWPPVIGTPTVASGVSLPGKLGTIKRSDGQLQATYDGHPLYTYVSDTSAGAVTGNGVNESGGLWWAMTPTGAKPQAANSGSGSGGSSGGGSSGGSGGYGY